MLPPEIRNYTVDDLITVFDTVEKKVHSAEASQDLIEAVGKLDRFNKRTGKLAFNEKMVKALSVFLFLAGAVLQLLDFVFKGDINPLYFMVLGIGLFLMTEGLEMVRKYTLRALNLLELVHWKSFCQITGLQLVQVRDGEKLWCHLSDNFIDLNRGDENQKITHMLKGTYEAAEHSIDFHFFRFSYDQELYNGKTRSLVQQTRYGIFCDFPFADNCLITQSGHSPGDYERWSSSSVAFNKAFETFYTSEISITKFLKPHVITQFLELEPHLNSMNVEVRDQKLCLSFENPDILGTRHHGLENMQGLIEEIRTHVDDGKLAALLTFIHELMKYNDQNF